jgi:hypothetical protein
VGLVARFITAQGDKRKRAFNKQCRVNELRSVLRTGDADARRMYQEASGAWDEAGQPDVPLITEWFARSQGWLADQDQ